MRLCDDHSREYTDFQKATGTACLVQLVGRQEEERTGWGLKERYSLRAGGKKATSTRQVTGSVTLLRKTS